MDFGLYNASYACNPSNPRNREKTWGNFKCQQAWQHSMGHYFCGGARVEGQSMYSSEKWLQSWAVTGDFMNLASSPNDLPLFILWHSEMMRQFYQWQTKQIKLDPKIDFKKEWPRKSTTPLNSRYWPDLYINEGCYLDDVINSFYPFTLSFITSPSHGYMMDYIDPRNENIIYETGNSPFDTTVCTSASRTSKRSRRSNCRQKIPHGQIRRKRWTMCTSRPTR